MEAKPKFSVAVDVDEVLGQYLKGYSAYYNSVHGTSLKVADFHSYKFWEVTGGTPEEAMKEVYRFHETDYFHKLEVVPGAVEGVAELAALPGVELHIVTSRHAEIAEATRKWIALHFPGSFGDRIHIGNHWGTATVKRVSKPDMCEAIGAQVLIDDSTVYCKEAAEHGLETILFDLKGGYGWSQERIEGPRVVRALDWPDVVARVRQLAYEANAREKAGAAAASGEQQQAPPAPAAVEAVRWPPKTQEEIKEERDCSACHASRGACAVM